MKLLSQYINACVQLLALMVLLHSPVATMGGPIDIVKKMIDAPIDDIQWADDENIFVLTDKKTLFRSQDKGRSWQNQARTLSAAAKGFSESEVEAIYTSPVNPAYVLFVGKGANSWVTTNMGNDYTYISKSLQDIRLHPTRASWILASSMSPGCERPSKTSHCFKGLLLSKDFGRTWKGINEYVVQFDWSPVFGKKDSNGHHSSDEIVYATVHKTKNGNQKFGFWSKDISFYKTTDFFASSDNTVVEFGNRFLFGEHNYLFVAAVNPQKENEVLLQISRDNVTHIDFQPAILPVSLSEHSYTILDTSEGSVFLHVNHQSFSGNAYAGHVYVSDWTGVVYSLSLPYNHRLNDGKCDFEKVEGIEGIYMANFIDEDEMDSVEKQYEKMSAETKKKRSLKKRRDRLHTKTVITYDKGGEWNYLTPPTVDASGNAIKCNKCHLHLHGVTDTFGPFYSSKNALGLIMATGTIGRYLEHNKEAVNTYLSRDAGLTWKEVAKGSHIYEFADHGGLVLMANDVDKTDTLLYSWDEGTTWNGLKISNDLINIENIIVEPKSTSTQVIVYGWQEDAGVMIFVDFAGLHERECQGYESAGSRHSDYEYWSPSDGRMNGKCLLGHTVQYTRRKADSQCYNPQEFERKTALDHCPCTEADYQCDYGYERANGTCT